MKIYVLRLYQTANSDGESESRKQRKRATSLKGIYFREKNKLMASYILSNLATSTS